MFAWKAIRGGAISTKVAEVQLIHCKFINKLNQLKYIFLMTTDRKSTFYGRETTSFEIVFNAHFHLLK